MQQRSRERRERFPVVSTRDGVAQRRLRKSAKKSELAQTHESNRNKQRATKQNCCRMRPKKSHLNIWKIHQEGFTGRLFVSGRTSERLRRCLRFEIFSLHRELEVQSVNVWRDSLKQPVRNHDQCDGLAGGVEILELYSGTIILLFCVRSSANTT